MTSVVWCQLEADFLSSYVSGDVSDAFSLLSVSGEGEIRRRHGRSGEETGRASFSIFQKVTFLFF